MAAEEEPSIEAVVESATADESAGDAETQEIEDMKRRVQEMGVSRRWCSHAAVTTWTWHRGGWWRRPLCIEKPTYTLYPK